MLKFISYGLIPSDMIEPHSFVPRKTDDAFYAIANTAAQELWNSLYTGGTHDDIKRFFNRYTDHSCPELWMGMLRSRRGLGKVPMARSVTKMTVA